MLKGRMTYTYQVTLFPMCFRHLQRNGGCSDRRHMEVDGGVARGGRSVQGRSVLSGTLQFTTINVLRGEETDHDII